jgi:membrane-associated PAP2 superfamily phosphatase
MFWRRHGWWPLCAFLTAFAFLELLGLDRPLAHALYFDADSRQWLGAGNGSWWARDILHSGGRWLVRLVAAAAVCVWAGSLLVKRLRTLRRGAGFVALAMLLSTGIVGGLKATSNVDCPWDLIEYGGDQPYVPLFADRPDELPRAKCFPGAHASSGFALLCFYFLWRDRSRKLAAWGLAVGLVTGLAFAIGQEARGAHFLSHNLTSAVIVWYVQLALYAWLLKPPGPALAQPVAAG